MRKELIALLIICCTITASAQTPAKKTKSVIFEFSETWCPPCGGWGIDVADTLEAKMVQADKGYIIGVKTTSTPTSLNAIGGDSLTTNFDVTAVPSFIINVAAINDGVTHNNAGDVARMFGKVTHFDSIAAVGGIAAIYTMTSNMITVTAKSKFWNTTTGSYYMSVMLAEDHISATQNNYPTNPALHVNVLRGALATSGTTLSASPWGEFVGTNNIAANQEFTKTFKTTIDASWNKTNLVIFAIIFKKNTNGIYEAVNIEKAIPATNSINELNTLAELTIYPNPATETIHAAINATTAINVDAYITDVQGRIVYQQKNIALRKGDNNLSINTADLTSGNYHLTLTNDKGIITRRIVIR